MRLVDLSHPIEDGMAIYPGLPPPRVDAIVDHDASRDRYKGKAEFHLGTVALTGASGTYMDSPFHRHRGMEDLSEVPLERLAGLSGICLDVAATADRATDASAAPEDLAGRAVLLRSGWASRWGTPAYWEPGPFIGPRLLDALVEAGPALVGTDSWTVDDVDDLSRPAHTRLLGAGILIVENLADLTGLPRDGFRFTAAPPRIVRGSNFPVRAFAELDG